MCQIICQLLGQVFCISTSLLLYLHTEGHKHTLPSTQTGPNFLRGHLNISALQLEYPSFISAPHWMMLSHHADAWHMLSGMTFLGRTISSSISVISRLALALKWGPRQLLMQLLFRGNSQRVLKSPGRADSYSVRHTLEYLGS